jgi:hypothetical protein
MTKRRRQILIALFVFVLTTALAILFDPGPIVFSGM